MTRQTFLVSFLVHSCLIAKCQDISTGTEPCEVQIQYGKMSMYPMYFRFETSTLDECVEKCNASINCTSVNFVDQKYCEFMSTVFDGPKDLQQFPTVNASSIFVENLHCYQIIDVKRLKRAVDLLKWVNENLNDILSTKHLTIPTIAIKTTTIEIPPKSTTQLQSTTPLQSTTLSTVPLPLLSATPTSLQSPITLQSATSLQSSLQLPSTTTSVSTTAGKTSTMVPTAQAQSTTSTFNASSQMALSSTRSTPNQSLPRTNTVTNTTNSTDQRNVELPCGTPVIKPRISSVALADSSTLRIVGGIEANPHSIPWQASLRYEGDHLCGGTLIHKRFVITAAHCVENRAPNFYKVVLGAHNIDKLESTQVVFNVSKFIQHPNYGKPLEDSNDIALIELETQANLSDNVGLLCLARNDPPVGSSCLLSGWGFDGIATPSNLHQVMVPTISNSICNDSKHYWGKVDDTMLCAGYENGGKDSCQGDSGGPLAYFDILKNQWQLIGVTSWGYDCAVARKPGVYARVSSSYLWIIAQLPL